MTTVDVDALLAAAQAATLRALLAQHTPDGADHA